MSRWRGAAVVVTGASRGIGRAVAHAAAARGARLGLIARSAEDLRRLQGQLGPRHVAEAVDVADRAALGRALRRVEESLGPIDVLVNNAGTGAYSAVLDTEPEVFERMVCVNYLGGCVWPTLAVLPTMCRRRHGHVVNVASIAGRVGAPFEAAYSASKFAMVGFSEALAVEAAPFSVRVSLVDPGAVATDFFEARGHAYERSFPKPISAERVARTVIDVVESGRATERIVPRFLRPAYLASKLVPALARWGTRRTFARELDALAARFAAEPQLHRSRSDPFAGSSR